MTTASPTSRPLPVAFVLLGAACALAPSLAMWGFTVDDALIPVRYAHNLATGAGYRFEAGGASTDGVTPLPWAFLVEPLCMGDAMVALGRLKALGVVAWTVGGGVLGARVGAMVRGEGQGQRDGARGWTGGAGGMRALGVMALGVMALAFPLGAWAASGMETGLAMALATVAATQLGRPRHAALLAGLAATLRPEMVAWAVVVALGATLLGGLREREGQGQGGEGQGQGREGAKGGARALGALGLGAGPFVACALARWAVFGRPAPLAVLAKPSDLAHGALYVAAASVVVLLPLCAFAPLALLRGRARGLGAARVLVVAFVAHALAVAFAGGDWMPYARLMVPVTPSLVVAFVALAGAAGPAGRAWSVARLAAAAAFGVLVALRAAPAGRGVHADRAELVARARPVLGGTKVVAALDIGWLSASTDARIVDLAGLTDPSIALLPGGHTSKRVDTAMLLDRGVDTVVVYSDVRVVEARLLASDLFRARFEPRETLPLGARGAFYTVYRLR